MFKSVLRNVLACLMICVFTVVESNDCRRHELNQLCTVDHGHAQCESCDLVSGIHGLPACTTRITFSLIPNQTDDKQHPTHIQLSDANFSHLANLSELSVITNRSTYGHFQLVLNGTSAALPLLGSLHILRLKVLQLPTKSVDMYSKLKHLEVLDLTRAKQLGLSNAKRIIGQNTAIKTLILKHIQHIRWLTYTPDLDIAHFICGTTVRFLDLSYNDIAYIKLSTKNCSSKLLHLNLDHNIIAAGKLDGSLALSIWTTFVSVETVSGSSTWQIVSDDGNLWTDGNHNIEFTQDLDEEDDETSPLSLLLQKSALPSLTAYDFQFWLEYIKMHCGNISYTDIAKCFRQDLCDFVQCLSPTLSIETCPKDDASKLAYFAKGLCHNDSCMLGYVIPIPPRLKSIVASNRGKLSKVPTYHYSPKPTTACVHPHNSLEYVNVSFTDPYQYLWHPYSGIYSISGVNKLKYFNIQGCQIPLGTFRLVSPITLLTELHIGGNIVPNNRLRTSLLQSYTNLTLLNLSNANLIDIEADTFAYHHRLSVLDLSYNRLNLSSLSSIDLSKTSIRSLNLSHNRLTAIPASLRGQLDQMDGLDLYLSENTFICNCDNLDFLEWVQSSTSITFHYAEGHACTDSPGNTIHNIEIASLHCNWYWMQPLIIVTSLLTLALFVFAACVAYWKRFHISNLIFRFHERFCVVRDEITATTFIYDAFVLYSGVDDDRQWVHYKLLTELEKVYGFRLCIHHRNFPAGVDIIDNIAQTIHTSRKVLVVMSPNFVRSDWCIEEVQMTRSLDRNKIIVVMYKDVLSPDVPKPTVISHLLETRTYIEWNETPATAQKLFWKKLRRALHSRQRVTNEESHPTGSCAEIILVPQPE